MVWGDAMNMGGGGLYREYIGICRNHGKEHRNYYIGFGA